DSTTAADSSSDDSDDQAGSFYAGCPDGGGASLECDLYQQDCPRGEKCMPWAEDGGDEWNATRCSPIADNPSDFDEPCMVEGSATSGIDNCVEGAMCFEVDAKTNEGTCQELCGGTEARPSCGDPADVCLAANDGLLPLCLPSCNPLMQDCGEGEGCFAADDEFLCIYTVAPDAAHGDPCGFINDCAPGQVCLDDALFSNCAGLACCSEVCSVADPNADAACATLDPVQACLPWYETPPAGLEDVGVCAQPLR
ncbi:MAG: ribulose phosphate epimerase, partial [Deltaproteobacteria bacterium]|nr:ribulose phosphate epimerase [Deltaproteobacteria bacterium]